jgi:hypothetical protein
LEFHEWLQNRTAEIYQLVFLSVSICGYFKFFVS